MKSNFNHYSVSNLTVHRLKLLFILALCLLMLSCGGKLIPRELKDYVSYTLKIDRRLIELQQVFRTEITLRVKPMSLVDALREERVLIRTCVEYFQRDNVTDFINDSLVFVVRLNIDPDVKIKWFAVANDLRMLIKNEMTMDDFADRCRKEENWSDDL